MIYAGKVCYGCIRKELRILNGSGEDVGTMEGFLEEMIS